MFSSDNSDNKNYDRVQINLGDNLQSEVVINVAPDLPFNLDIHIGCKRPAELNAEDNHRHHHLQLHQNADDAAAAQYIGTRQPNANASSALANDARFPRQGQGGTSLKFSSSSSDHNHSNTGSSSNVASISPLFPAYSNSFPAHDAGATDRMNNNDNNNINNNNSSSSSSSSNTIITNNNNCCLDDGSYFLPQATADTKAVRGFDDARPSEGKTSFFFSQSRLPDTTRMGSSFPSSPFSSLIVGASPTAANNLFSISASLSSSKVGEKNFVETSSRPFTSILGQPNKSNSNNNNISNNSANGNRFGIKLGAFGGGNSANPSNLTVDKSLDSKIFDASEKGIVKEVEMLIDSGADPNAKNKVST